MKRSQEPCEENTENKSFYDDALNFFVGGFAISFILGCMEYALA